LHRGECSEVVPGFQGEEESLTQGGIDPWTRMSGWAGTCHASSRILRCESLDDLRQLTRDPDPWLPVGSGCSYGDAAILDQGRLVRLVDDVVDSPDPLEDLTVQVAASTPLRNLLPVLARSGVTLPVMPGVLDATVGGMLAADVHGKNHPVRGSFRSGVRGFRMMLPDGEMIECSRDQQPEIFEATVGGMGLTGIVIDVVLEVIPLHEATATVDVVVSSNLHETLEEMKALAGRREYVAAWIDATATGRQRGRGVITGGDLAGERSTQASEEPVQWNPRSGSPLPAPLRGMLGPFTIGLHNRFRYWSASWGRNSLRCSAQQLLFPLERWSDWRRAYPPGGFHQHQSQIPLDGCEESIRALLERAGKGPCPPALVVAKMFGPGGGWLSFPDEGMTLSMDFRSDDGVVNKLTELDAMVASIGGKVYLAKDTTLTADLLREMYPQLDRFLQVRDRVDPARILQSQLSRRLDI